VTEAFPPVVPAVVEERVDVLDRLVANHDLTRAQANSAFFSSLPLRELAPKRR